MDSLLHEMTCDLKRVALELGETPSRRQYQFNGGKYSASQIERRFGSWTTFIKACGLEDRKEAQKAKAKIKYDDIVEVVQEYQHKQAYEGIRIPKIIHVPSEHTLVSIGDPHAPFMSTKALTLFYFLIEQVKPTAILFPGDQFDMFSHSKFPRSRLTFNPKEEFDLAKSMLQEVIDKCLEISPKSKITMLLGNHDIRPMKRCLESFPEAEVFLSKAFREAMTFQGATTIHDTRELYEILPNVCCHHGHFPNLGDHVKRYRKNIIVGHTHRGGTYHLDNLWELNTGLGGDPEAKHAFSYTPTKLTNWTVGCGLVDGIGCRFISI